MKRIFYALLALISAVFAFVTGAYVVYFTAQTAILPIEACRPFFIFTSDSVQTCGQMHTADAVLAQFRSPLVYLFLAALATTALSLFLLIKSRKRSV
ncbi:hypothetical protein [Alkalicoccus luteus]|uniref:Uncharacterized protein n=1 Tax=Alkalicoccus luteus TaxID=1237094 RepID=A0A969PVD0_9BACI|nr:hypothetical protein [Alkalicoccus luteus]NJP39061.1 hypothetical protein [Alkalicoccus luteus]